MSEVGPIQPTRATTTPSFTRTPRTSFTAGATSRNADQVEFSSEAQFLSKLAELPDIRQSLVDRVRAEIDSDTYITDDKIDLALDRLVEDI